jgi:hypothetical protein
VAAHAAAVYWRDYPGVRSVEWFLRDDISRRGPVLLFTLCGRGWVHVTELAAGKPVSSHPETCCGILLDWDAVAAQVCWPEDGPPCVDCLMVVREHHGDARSTGPDLVHPHHPDASDVPFPAPRSPHIARHEQRPMSRAAVRRTYSR